MIVQTRFKKLFVRMQSFSTERIFSAEKLLSQNVTAVAGWVHTERVPRASLYKLSDTTRIDLPGDARLPGAPA